MFDILGREVATLYDNIAKSGQYYTATFNGLQYSSGVYLYMIESNNQRVVKKMLMLK
jgi:phosphatidate phosphatase PAH1